MLSKEKSLKAALSSVNSICYLFKSAVQQVMKTKHGMDWCDSQ